MKRINNFLEIIVPTKTIILIIFFFSYNNAFTQKELNDYIQQVAEKNENLKVLHQDYLVSLAKADQVNVLPDPEISLGLFTPEMNGHAGINWFRIEGMQSFPWFGTLKAKKDLALANAAVKNKSIPVASLEIIYQLKKSWFEIYEFNQKQKLYQTNLELLDRLENTIITNIETGKSSAVNVVKIHLQKEKIKTDLALLEYQVNIPLATFNQLLQQQSTTKVDIQSTLTFPDLPSNENDFSLVESRPHPIIQQLNHQQIVANKALTINSLNRKPSFSLGFRWGYVQPYPNINFDGNGTDMLLARAKIKLPIYTKQYSAKEQEEEHRIIAIDHQKKEVISQFNQMITQAKAEYKSAKLKIDLYEKQKKLTHSAIEILEGNYSTQGDGFDEILQLQMELIEYDIMILEAIVDAHIAVAKIEKIISY